VSPAQRGIGSAQWADDTIRTAQVELGRPAVADDHRAQLHPLGVYRDHLGSHALPRLVVAGHLDDRRVHSYGPRLDPLVVVEPGHVRNEALDDERPFRLEHSRHVAEALRLPFLAEQAEQRVEHQVHQPEPAADGYLGHVTHGDRDRLPARLCPQPLHHRGRGVDPLHSDPPGRQRQRHPACPDGQLQHAPVPGQAGQELHRTPRVHVPVVVVVNGRPPIAVERGIIQSGHSRH
jgi:hypothetical protein